MVVSGEVSIMVMMHDDWLELIAMWEIISTAGIWIHVCVAVVSTIVVPLQLTVRHALNPVKAVTVDRLRTSFILDAANSSIIGTRSTPISTQR